MLDRKRAVGFWCVPVRALAGRGARCAVSMLGLAALLVAISCVPEPVVEVFVATDLRPPAVLAWGPLGGSELVVSFDEEVRADAACFASSPGPGVTGVRLGDDGRSVVVSLAGAQGPGEAYAVSGLVADAAGNMSSFVLPYWGFNPEPPKMLINEIISEGSATHPDAVELYVAEGGNCAGMALFLGLPADFTLRYVFPSIKVAAGDYMVLHLKPQGLEVELDECLDKAASGGIDACASAWDLWYRGGDGALPGKNGALTLCDSPRGKIVDALLYSERTGESDSKYGGFGSAALRDRVGAIVAAGAWVASDPPRPEDCARSAGVTSTRTLCRSSSSFDSDSRTDWHVTPTKGATLGAVNTDAVHAP